MQMRLFRSDIIENLWLAMATLRANKLRSFLTVTGVIIGVITVMLIASLISGIDSSVRKEVESYKEFLFKLVKNPTERPATRIQDIVWHTHILYTRDYHLDCERIYGHYLHHQPDIH